MNSNASNSNRYSDREVADRVREALKQTRCDELDPVAIKVAVEQGKVFLTGIAPTYEALTAATDAASQAPGVVKVENDILIEPL